MQYPSLQITVHDIDHHRNGICGAPFHVAIVTSSDDPAHTKVAIVFDEPYHVAVLDISKLASGVIAFRENSYRGDLFEPSLRQAIADFRERSESEHSITPPTQAETANQEIELIDLLSDCFKIFDAYEKSGGDEGELYRRCEPLLAEFSKIKSKPTT